MGNSYQTPREYSDFYVSGNKIGAGTFAIVKHCTRKTDKKEFAVKILDKRFLNDREIKGLKGEIKILKTLYFPHVIKMVDVFDDGTRVKMVLELCEGGDLFDQISSCPQKRFDEPRAAKTTVIIARALKYLHEHSVVHRDLKPENILFTKNGVLKITDFGLAHLKSEPECHVMDTCCGTPHYVAPEVLSNGEYSFQVDFWSLGVILYIMLSGYQPFTSDSVHAMYGMIIRGQYRFSSPHWDTISEEAKSCVRSLMSVDYKKRLNYDELIKHPWITQHVNLQEFQEEEDRLFKEQKALLDSIANNNTKYNNDDNMDEIMAETLHFHLQDSDESNDNELNLN